MTREFLCRVSHKSVFGVSFSRSLNFLSRNDSRTCPSPEFNFTVSPSDEILAMSCSSWPFFINGQFISSVTQFLFSYQHTPIIKVIFNCYLPIKARAVQEIAISVTNQIRENWEIWRRPRKMLQWTWTDCHRFLPAERRQSIECRLKARFISISSVSMKKTFAITKTKSGSSDNLDSVLVKYATTYTCLKIVIVPYSEHTDRIVLSYDCFPFTQRRVNGRLAFFGTSEMPK